MNSSPIIPSYITLNGQLGISIHLAVLMDMSTFLFRTAYLKVQKFLHKN
jgi:hypothetical protein